MRFTIAAAAAALVAGVSANSNGTVWVTEVVDQYTTVCPAATELTHNGVTYTATASQTITITNCPCTVTHAVNYNTPAAPAATGMAAANNGTGNAVPASAAGSAAATPAAATPANAASATPAQYTGAANQLSGAGAALAGIFAVAAYAL